LTGCILSVCINYKIPLSINTTTTNATEYKYNWHFDRNTIETYYNLWHCYHLKHNIKMNKIRIKKQNRKLNVQLTLQNKKYTFVKTARMQRYREMHIYSAYITHTFTQTVSVCDCVNVCTYVRVSKCINILSHTHRLSQTDRQ